MTARLVHLISWLAAAALTAAGFWGAWSHASSPAVRVEAERQRDSTRFAPVPAESVRVLPSQLEPGCLPARVLARLHVRRRLFSPSSEAVTRALRRDAGALGANALAPTVPTLNDLPVLGTFDRLLGGEIEATERLRRIEEKAGREVAIRCPDQDGHRLPNAPSEP